MWRVCTWHMQTIRSIMLARLGLQALVRKLTAISNVSIFFYKAPRNILRWRLDTIKAASVMTMPLYQTYSKGIGNGNTHHITALCLTVGAIISSLKYSEMCSRNF
jgi:hypothetical protein